MGNRSWRSRREALRNEDDLPWPALCAFEKLMRDRSLRQARRLADMGSKLTRVDQLGEPSEPSPVITGPACASPKIKQHLMRGAGHDGSLGVGRYHRSPGDPIFRIRAGKLHIADGEDGVPRSKEEWGGARKTTSNRAGLLTLAFSIDR